MTHSKAFDLLEEVLKKYIPITDTHHNTVARRLIRAAALRCAWPADYTEKSLIELEENTK